MNILSTHLPGVLILEPRVYPDSRGHFLESYSRRRYQDVLGVDLDFVQDNLSQSRQGVLRGLHFQRRHAQGKLISVLHGRILDVVVDIQPDSPSFGRHLAVELDAEKPVQLWIPPGFAHGFYVLSEQAVCLYKCTDYYHPDDEGGLAWNCPRLGIAWPTTDPILSARDQAHPGLEQFLRPAP